MELETKTKRGVVPLDAVRRSSGRRRIASCAVAIWFTCNLDGGKLAVDRECSNFAIRTDVPNHPRLG